MHLKNLFAKVHLWLGLPLGILFFIITFSGALYMWVPEISRLVYHRNVDNQRTSMASVSGLKATIDREFPQGDFRTALYRDSTTAAEVLLYGQGTHYIAFLDPFSAEMLHLQDMNKGWLNKLKGLHRNLLLGDVGKKIVHWGTLLFLVMMISGMVIWWPAKKSGFKRRLTIKGKAKPKRFNLDLHRVLGFYASWILIFSVVTGLFWGFEVVRETLRSVTGENEITYDMPASDSTGIRGNQNKWKLLDSLAVQYRAENPGQMVRISNPHPKDDPVRIAVIDPAMLVYNVNHYYFDRYSGQQLEGNFENGVHTTAPLFHTLHGLVYDIHLGNIWGFPGRMLMFLAALTAASFPVTGFLIWFNKRKPKQKLQ